MAEVKITVNLNDYSKVCLYANMSLFPNPGETNTLYIDESDFKYYKYNVSDSEYVEDTSITDYYITAIKTCDADAYAAVDRNTAEFLHTMYIVTDGVTSNPVNGVADLYYANKKINEIQTINGIYPPNADGSYNTYYIDENDNRVDLIQDRFYVMTKNGNANLFIRHDNTVYPLTSSTIKSFYYDENTLIASVTLLDGTLVRLLTIGPNGELPDAITSLIKGTMFVNTFVDLPETGDNAVIYVVRNENTSYRWDATTSEYVSIGGGSGGDSSYISEVRKISPSRYIMTTTDPDSNDSTHQTVWDVTKEDSVTTWTSDAGQTIDMTGFSDDDDESGVGRTYKIIDPITEEEIKLGEYFNDYDNNIAEGKFSHNEGTSGTGTMLTTFTWMQAKQSFDNMTKYVLKYGDTFSFEMNSTTYQYKVNIVSYEESDQDAKDNISIIIFYNSNNMYYCGYDETADRLDKDRGVYVSISNLDGSVRYNDSLIDGDDKYNFRKIDLSITLSSLTNLTNISTYNGDLSQLFVYYNLKEYLDAYGITASHKMGPYGTATHVEGSQNLAIGDYSHAEGQENVIIGYEYSSNHVEGARNTISGYQCHAEGSYNIMEAAYQTHVEGSRNAVRDYADYVHVEGSSNRVHGCDYAHAEGYSNYIAGSNNHVEGYGNSNVGQYYCHAEGANNTVGDGSSRCHVEGYSNYVFGNGYGGSHAEGCFTTAIGRECSHAEGYKTYAGGGWNYFGAHAEGAFTTATDYCHSEGYCTCATGGYGAHSEGEYTYALGNFSHTEGYQSTAGYGSHTEGMWSYSNSNSHAEGYQTTVDANYSHAEGGNTSISGYGSANHVEGKSESKGGIAIISNGSGNHAEGYIPNSGGTNIIYNGNGNHLEGTANKINNGNYSHVEGVANTADLASGTNHVHLEGCRNLSKSQYSHLEGIDNQITTAMPQGTIHIEGCSNRVSAESGYVCDTHISGSMSNLCPVGLGKIVNTFVVGAGHKLSPGTTASDGEYNCRVSNAFVAGAANQLVDNDNYQYGHNHDNFTILGAGNQLTNISCHNTFISGAGNMASGTGSSAPRLDDAQISGAGNLIYATISGTHLQGNGNNINGPLNCSHFEGNGSTVSGSTLNHQVHVEGGGHTLEDFSNSHVEGDHNTVKYNNFVHVEGQLNQAVYGSPGTHVEGYSSTAMNGAYYAHAEGMNHLLGYSATASHIEGANNTIYYSSYSHAEGQANSLYQCGDYCHAEGFENTINNTSLNSHVEGKGNLITNLGVYAHAEGLNHVVGYSSTASHVEGMGNTVSASANSPHVEGLYNSLSTGVRGVHIEGGYNTVSAGPEYAHIGGSYNQTTGGATCSYIGGEHNLSMAGNSWAHLEGYYNTNGGAYSYLSGAHSYLNPNAYYGFGHGLGLSVDKVNQAVFGSYNDTSNYRDADPEAEPAITEDPQLFIVGNGTSTPSETEGEPPVIVRSNAFSVSKEGNVIMAGKELVMTGDDDQQYVLRIVGGQLTVSLRS